MHATPSTVQVMRGASDDGAWEIARGSMPAALRGAVRARYGFSERGSRFPVRNETAASAVVMIVSFGAPYLVGDGAAAGSAAQHPLGFVGGLCESFATSQATGDSQCIQLMLSPLGAQRLLGGLPMHELANRTIGLDSVLGGGEAQRLASMLHDAADWSARFRVVDRWLVDRIHRAPAAPAGVSHAWRRLDEAAGRLEVGDLAREIGCSRKYLAERFREHVGLPPKPVARVMRFERALRLLDGAGADVRWSDLALRAGYYDQAHLIRDFRQFAGTTPGAFLQARLSGASPSAEGDDPEDAGRSIAAA